MSRDWSDPRDHADAAEERTHHATPPGSRPALANPERTSATRTREPEEGPDRLALPRGEGREPVFLRGREFHLRGSETRILETVGAFRVVPTQDLENSNSTPDRLASDLRHLTREGLIERTHLSLNGSSTAVVTLTRTGKDLLESHRDPDRGAPRQAYHAGFVKPRELAHDAQLYRLYRAEAARIHAAGGRVRRVVLDYEIKRDYQSHLHRRTGHNAPHDVARDRREFAEQHQLPIVDGHLELPDLRIEYETADGRVSYRDVELVTDHYSRGQLAGKSAAGFSLYRASGAKGNRGAARGGTPQDPRQLEWLK